ncbi:hypothetical protein EV361DRAFT_933138 [Lentinula raphanica]|nr:hypothetical protein EV361DRAFT_933138 [Lentinula raphanica]
MTDYDSGQTSIKKQSQIPDSTLTLSIGIGNTAPVPGFPSPSSSFVPPPAVASTEFASVKDKKKNDSSRKNSKVGSTNGISQSNTQPQPDPQLNSFPTAVDRESMISPTTPTPDSLYRLKSPSDSLTVAGAAVIELSKDLPTDNENHTSSSTLAAKAFGAAASSEASQSPIIPQTPFSKPSSSHSLSKTPSRTPSNPPTPSRPGFHLPSSRSLKSNRPAPPSPAMSRRTSGVGANAAASPVAKRFSSTDQGVQGPGALERSHSLRNSATFSTRNQSTSPKAALPMSANPHRFSSPAFRRDSSTMSVPAPLPLTPVPGSASLPPGSNSLFSAGLSSAGLSSAGLSSAALRTATTASTALTKGKATGIASQSQMRKPVRIRDYAYAPEDWVPGPSLADASALALWENDARFLGLGMDGKGLHVPTPNRIKVLNKALLTSTNISGITANLNATYTMWKASYKRVRKERKAAAKRKAKEAKRERAQARYSMNSVRSVGSTSSTASSVSSTGSRSEVSDVDEREDDDEEDGLGGWAGFRFGLARLSWGFGNSNSTGLPAPASTSKTQNASNTTSNPSVTASTASNNANPNFKAFPSQSDLDRNFGFDATSSESGDESSNNSTDTEEGRGLDSPSPLDYDRGYNYDEGAYGQIPNSAFPSASPYPGSGEGYVYEDDSLDSIEEGELVPGQYRALYSFEPEGPSEMKLVEGEVVKVIGRGGGGGWAVVVDKYAEVSSGSENAETGGVSGDGDSNNSTATHKYALVPESYLEFIQADDLTDGEVKDGTKMTLSV